MGAEGVTTTVLTVDTSDTTSTESLCHGIARRWQHAGLCSALPQGAQGSSRTGEIPGAAPRPAPRGEGALSGSLVCIPGP